MNLPFFLSRKIYSSGDNSQKVSKPVISIAMLGVAIGIAVMIISVSVVLGFKHSIRDKVIGFGSHVQVTNFMTLQAGENYPIVINDSVLNILNKVEGVSKVQRFAMAQGILKTDKDFLGIQFKGVAEDFDSTFIHQHILEGSFPTFSAESSSNKIVISSYIARKLHLACGERVFCYFVNDSGMRMRRFTIAGIYETNLSQYDESICFTDMKTTIKLNGWEKDQATGAEIIISDFNSLEKVADDIAIKINKNVDHNGDTYTSKAITEINPSIFAWLDLLNLNVWVILALMLIVASVTMTSGLLIIILERANMIGILKALGTRNATIRRTFLYFSAYIVGKGLLIGNVISLGLITLQHYTGMVKLDPHVYYVNVVPVELSPIWLIAINASTLIICVMVLVIPSYLISHIKPAKAIRFE